MSHLPLTDTGDWRLSDEAQDIRGFEAVDATGARLGRVAQLVVDTATETVSTVLLDDGTGIAVAELTIGDGVVTVSRRATEAVAHGALTTDTDAERDDRTGGGSALPPGYDGRVVRRTPGGPQ
ncbi:MAG TPA: PRC-barrel domain-containing protein [Rubricoccaceae bacterium]|jgi:sporulation protein YlmC with PRC-barrel domain